MPRVRRSLHRGLIVQFGVTAAVELAKHARTHGCFFCRKHPATRALRLPLHIRIRTVPGAMAVSPGHALTHHVLAHVLSIHLQSPDQATIDIVRPQLDTDRFVVHQRQQGIARRLAPRLATLGRIDALDAQFDRLLIALGQQQDGVAVDHPTDPGMIEGLRRGHQSTKNQRQPQLHAPTRWRPPRRRSALGKAGPISPSKRWAWVFKLASAVSRACFCAGSSTSRTRVLMACTCGMSSW